MCLGETPFETLGGTCTSTKFRNSLSHLSHVAAQVRIWDYYSRKTRYRVLERLITDPIGHSDEYLAQVAKNILRQTVLSTTFSTIETSL